MNSEKKGKYCAADSWSRLQCRDMTWKLPDNLEILNCPSTVFFHGSKEKTIIKGAHILKGRLPEMRIICTGDYGHGELMFIDPQRYTELIANEMRKI